MKVSRGGRIHVCISMRISETLKREKRKHGMVEWAHFRVCKKLVCNYEVAAASRLCPIVHLVYPELVSDGKGV